MPSTAYETHAMENGADRFLLCVIYIFMGWGGGGTGNMDRDQDGRPCAKVRGEKGHDTEEKLEELEGDLGG